MPPFPLAGFKDPVFRQNKKAVFAAEKVLLMKNRFLRHVPGRIRTAGLPLRRRTLYPAELRKHRKNIILYSGKMQVRSAGEYK